MKRELRRGYTTGACATAAATAALRTLLSGAQQDTVVVTLPDGEEVWFRTECCGLHGDGAKSCVRKDAGDDPDVTNGMLVCGEVVLDASLPDGHVVFLKGEGIGEVTLPGLGVEVGEPAINPVPRAMIGSAVRGLLVQYGVRGGVRVTVSVPGGEALARKTLNGRVGVRGGLSIIGTSGRVIPYSEEAFLDSTARMVQVARQSGARELVVTAGIRSEKLLKPFFSFLPDTAFIHYGNRIGSTLELIGEENGFSRVTVGVMLAKATKLAQGEHDLSSRNVDLNRDFIAGLVRDAGYGEELVHRAGRLELVRALVDIIPFGSAEPFYRELAVSCRNVCRSCLPSGNLTFVLIAIDSGFIRCDEHGCRDMHPQESFSIKKQTS
ncbi:hypothetical protein CHL67_04995 [Prosthecochloris sp. GSB1]|uniref:cobalt-precorrin-5B (C(1))-methyltransferase CbiD n=1 Tax=Prosthecochloris sp. GSB1 TaxID=281093 RepID=UPI000B8C9FB7|nr:cobalt-precorrin-5B (C(1))-methyltransferase CbiD [Prosthecochloris sp. GSB1]ASQ90366.1 hypothetical protein CHL67_04995 [Prosthecochloris sp. GSB1]